METRLSAYTDTGLAGKAATVHTHPWADVTGSQAGVEAAIAALESGDKIAWETGGGDYVELWAERIAAGASWTNIYYSDFSTDPFTSGWTNPSPAHGAALTWSSAGYIYDNAAIGTHTGARLDTDATDQDRITLELYKQAAGAQFIEIGFLGSSNQQLRFYYEPSSGTNGYMDIHDPVGGSNPSTTAISPAPTYPLVRFMRFTRNGNVLKAELFNDLGAAAIATINHTLVTGSQATFGAGVNLKPYIEIDRGNVTGTEMRGEDFRLERSTTLGEQRDLYMAITPASGTRTVRRLWGVEGVNNFRTDLLMQQIADAKGDLLVATAADAIARLPVGANGQVLTADSAVSAGVKWADTGSSAVEGWHVVGAAGEPAFQNSWVAYGGDYQAPRFKKDRGRVQLQGMMKSGSVNAASFTLPAGYRPALGVNGTFGRVRFSHYNGGAIEVHSDGAVMANTSAGNTEVRLDGLSFYVD